MSQNESHYKILTFNGHNLPPEFRIMIESQFLRSLRKGNEYFKLIEKDMYYTLYRTYVNSLIDRDESLLRIAILSDDPDNSLGWAISAPGKLHYIFVSPEIRGKGIATSLLIEPIKRFSHITQMILPIWNNKYKDAKFNPFI